MSLRYNKSVIGFLYWVKHIKSLQGGPRRSSALPRALRCWSFDILNANKSKCWVGSAIKSGDICSMDYILLSILSSIPT